MRVSAYRSHKHKRLDALDDLAAQSLKSLAAALGDGSDGGEAGVLLPPIFRLDQRTDMGEEGRQDEFIVCA
jgi:hypothetical protein